MRNINEEHIENEIPKHRKKRPSSTSKSFDKTRHKHEYVGKCIVKYPPYIQGGNSVMLLTTYCTICGKIYDSKCPIVEEDITRRNGSIAKQRRHMKNEEILEKYKDLEIIEMSEHFQKYIPIVVKSE